MMMMMMMMVMMMMMMKRCSRKGAVGHRWDTHHYLHNYYRFITNHHHTQSHHDHQTQNRCHHHHTLSHDHHHNTQNHHDHHHHTQNHHHHHHTINHYHHQTPNHHHICVARRPSLSLGHTQGSQIRFGHPQYMRSPQGSWSLKTKKYQYMVPSWHKVSKDTMSFFWVFIVHGPSDHHHHQHQEHRRHRHQYMKWIGNVGLFLLQGFKGAPRGKALWHRR